ncbi:MAG: DUF1284 domain-containing protein [Candidatus Sericytochromatia bacterium]|nr:DUF1284 domain-containing protein [Candidatus Sericytochromatia bacterium]
MTHGEPLPELRAHHVMCVATFAGKGYSAGFVREMTRVWQRIREGGMPEIRVTAHADAVCGACPHLRHPDEVTSCRFHESTSGRDRRMLKAMGWLEGDRIDLAAGLARVHGEHADLMEQVCVGCEWVPICRQRKFTLLDPSFTLPTVEDAPRTQD